MWRHHTLWLVIQTREHPTWEHVELPCPLGQKNELRATVSLETYSGKMKRKTKHERPKTQSKMLRSLTAMLGKKV